MINTNSFIQKLVVAGYTDLCVVPCSFAKNIINAALNQSDSIAYVPCANEGIACSIAAGLVMSGRKPIVIAQSSGLTNMGSCITSLLKPYKIRFPIMVSWRTYMEGDSEVQHKLLATKLPDLIDAYGYKHDLLVDCIDDALLQLERCFKNDLILVLSDGLFSKVILDDEHLVSLSTYPSRMKYLENLAQSVFLQESIFIGTTGNTAREMFSCMPNTKNFYMAGNMGGALSLGLGAYLAGQNVVVCGGDAEFVMHMGALTTTGRYRSSAAGSLTYIVFDNESNKSTGGQNTMQNHVDYLGVASSCGLGVYPKKIATIDDFEDAKNSIGGRGEILMMHVKCDFDDITPRPPLDVVLRSTKMLIG